jgi:cell wall-associated NlpC family hydrolase
MTGADARPAAGRVSRVRSAAGVGCLAAVLAVWGCPATPSGPGAQQAAPRPGSSAAAAESRLLAAHSFQPRAASTHAAVVAAGEPAAVQRARRLVGTVGPWSHLCLGFVRTVFGLPGRDPSAIAAWRAARTKHAGDRQPPAGVPVFWSGGGPGHVAVSTGDGWIVTSDFPSAGRVSRIPISVLQAVWHLRYLGWTEDLEGVHLHRPRPDTRRRAAQHN